MSLLVRVQNRLARARQHRWRGRAYHSAERHVVIGGSPRSGTTLVRRLLDEHDSFCCGPESNILLPGRIEIERLARGYDIPTDELRAMLRVSRSQGAFVDAFAARYRSGQHKPRWAEKTPLNIWHIGWALDRFPEARVIHVIRDGRDVVCSMRDFPDRRWTPDGWVDTPRDLSVEELARRWVKHTGKGMAWRADPRYLEVRYEALVESTAAVMERLLTFLGEPPGSMSRQQLDEERARTMAAAAPRPDAAAAITATSVGRWKRDLAAEDREVVKRIAGARLVDLGYAEGTDW